jgi:hypothetical protein
MCTISLHVNNPNILIGAIKGGACSRHNSKEFSYLYWDYWAEQKTKQGEKQKQCKKCGYWYFRDEF